jgi:peptidoglycan/xylan/chitin deacetylase (PgdA/CDA1 family)
MAGTVPGHMLYLSGMKRYILPIALVLVVVSAVGVGTVFGVWSSVLFESEAADAQTAPPLSTDMAGIPEMDTEAAMLENLMMSRYVNPYEGKQVRQYGNDAVVVPILMYHYIESPPETSDPNIRDLYVSPEMFEKQMKYLYLNSYKTVTLADLLAALRGETELDPKSVIITLDDLYQSQVDEALPRLNKYGFKAIFFVNVYSSGAYDARIRAVIDAGQEIGCHGYTHTDVRGMTAAELDFEMGKCKTVIENKFNVSVRHFAYPGCTYDDNAVSAAGNIGYETAVTCVTPWNGHVLDDRYHLARRLISNDYDKFIGRLEDREGVW